MKRKNVKVTTIELTKRDEACVEAIQKHIRSQDPIYTVSRQVAIVWALRQIVEDLNLPCAVKDEAVPSA